MNAPRVGEGIPWLEPDWPAPAGVRAAFTLRSGGVSAAPWDSLNVGIHVGDDPAAVVENRRRLHGALGLPGEPLWLDQVHGVEVVDADTATQLRPRGDAVVAARSGVVCAIQVADCLPVLFASLDGQRIGAAHAGWRGLAGGVLEATLAALDQPASQFIVWLGPAIGAAHFEVGDEVLAAFQAQRHRHAGDPAAAFRRNARGRWDCDLYELARQRLAAAGVHSAWGGGEDTCGDPGRYFSHRRGAPTGRHVALLWRDTTVRL
ncbi:MAG: peptidoglycan editing factor PgeF [Steroidobacteraceae bacterium]